MVPEKGQRLADRYRLERRIGRGGMGEVWAATHLVTRRAVAVKLVLNTHRITPLVRERFFREARAASKVRHPGVIEILDAFTVGDDVPVIVMELLRGETLSERLKRDGKLGLKETADIMIQVVSAVGTAHARGIVHRDLKPANIFLEQTDTGAARVKVLDFGIAKTIQSEADGALTGTGQVLGTPAYMAPERCRGDANIDHRADVWAVGILLYELLSGERPIRGDSIGLVVEHLLTEGVPPLRALVPDAPFDLAIAARQMLERDVEARPADLRSIAEVLARHATVEAPQFGAPAEEAPASEEPEAEGGDDAAIETSAPMDAAGTTLDASVARTPHSAASISRRTVAAIAAVALAGLTLTLWLRNATFGPTVPETAEATSPTPSAESPTVLHAEPAPSAAEPLKEKDQSVTVDPPPRASASAGHAARPRPAPASVASARAAPTATAAPAASATSGAPSPYGRVVLDAP